MKNSHNQLRVVFTILITNALILFLPEYDAVAQEESAFSDSIKQTPPEFPLKDDSLEAGKYYEIRSYPSLSVNIAPTFGKADSEKLDATYDLMENAYGVRKSSHFSESRLSLTAGMRAHFSQLVAIWGEYFLGGGADDDGSTVGVVSFSLMISPIVSNNLSISLGAGYAQTYVEAKRVYYANIPGTEETLNFLKLNRSSKGGLPISLLLEFYGKTLQRHRVYLSLKYILAGEYSDTADLYGTPDQSAGVVPIKIDMNSLWISIGLVIGS